MSSSLQTGLASSGSRSYDSHFILEDPLRLLCSSLTTPASRTGTLPMHQLAPVNPLLLICGPSAGRVRSSAASASPARPSCPPMLKIRGGFGFALFPLFPAVSSRFWPRKQRALAVWESQSLSTLRSCLLLCLPRPSVSCFHVSKDRGVKPHCFKQT